MDLRPPPGFIVATHANTQGLIRIGAIADIWPARGDVGSIVTFCVVGDHDVQVDETPQEIADKIAEDWREYNAR